MKPIQIPEYSYYYGVRDSIEGIADGKMQANGLTPREYAVKAIREIEKGTTGKHWVGGGATVARLASWLLPQSIIVCSERLTT